MRRVLTDMFVACSWICLQRSVLCRLERQRKVNEVIPMQDIHAFTMKTWTPEQYEEKKAKA